MESGGADISRNLPSETEPPSNGPSMQPSRMEEDVRAPIAPRQETLIGHGGGYDDEFMDDTFAIHGMTISH
jgi:hypothetical protein